MPWAPEQAEGVAHHEQVGDVHVVGVDQDHVRALLQGVLAPERGALVAVAVVRRLTLRITGSGPVRRGGGCRRRGAGGRRAQEPRRCPGEQARRRSRQARTLALCGLPGVIGEETRNPLGGCGPAEPRKVEERMLPPASQSLIKRVALTRALAEQERANMAISKVGVVGCGLMGHGISQICAQAGWDVVVREIDQEAARQGDGQDREAARPRGREGQDGAVGGGRRAWSHHARRSTTRTSPTATS